jgi:hypothetical protein
MIKQAIVVIESRKLTYEPNRDWQKQNVDTLKISRRGYASN